MFHGVMKMSFKTLNCPPILGGSLRKKEAHYTTRTNSSSMPKQVSSMLLQADESGNFPESKKFPCSVTALEPCHTPNSLFRQSNIVGIIGGVSISSTLIFLEKLAYHGGESIPYVVCSDPPISSGVPNHFPPLNGKRGNHFHHFTVVENLRRKRGTLEQSGACCIVMPCHISHVWHNEVSKGCSVPFLDVGDCVATELKEAEFKPLEAGSNVRIGVLAANAGLVAGFYQDKLQTQGFEVVLPDKPTMEHTIIPAIEALNKNDREGARTLLRIAIQFLLVRAVNTIILASDEFQALLPRDDPLLKKCVDPMDSLARSTIKWAQSTQKVHKG